MDGVQFVCFPLVSCVLGDLSEVPSSNPRSRTLIPVFSSRSSVDLALLFGSAIHSELISVFGEQQGPSFSHLLWEAKVSVPFAHPCGLLTWPLQQF